MCTLRAILQVGYVQGMNDVLSMMLVVLDDEADTYTCFASHMLNVAFDFQPVGMKSVALTHNARTTHLLTHAFILSQVEAQVYGVASEADGQCSLLAHLRTGGG